MSLVSITKDTFLETPSVDETPYISNIVIDFAQDCSQRLFGGEYATEQNLFLSNHASVVAGLFLAPLIRFAIGLLIHL